MDLRGVLPGQFGHTKIQDLHDPVRAQHDIFGLNVAMNYASFVGGLKCGSHLDADLEHFTPRHSSVRQMLSLRLTFNGLGSDEVERIRLPDLVDSDDVG